jgi:zinc D-Ala-D-Ala carboxypeptidase
MTLLTEHFTMEEFTDSQTAARRGIPNIPRPESREHINLQRTAWVMEKVRTILGDNPILISSGYRSPKVNTAVKGSKNSAHIHGLAVDFTCPSFGTPLEICQELELHMNELGIDQLIHEYNTWVHLGLSATDMMPRHMALTIDKSGTKHGFA